MIDDDNEYEEKSAEEWVEEEDEEENARFDAEMAALHSKLAHEQAQFAVVEEATERWRLNSEEYEALRATRGGPHGLPVGMKETLIEIDSLLKHPFGIAEVMEEDRMAELVELGSLATLLLPPRGKLSAAQVVCAEAKANFGALDKDNFIRALWVQVKWQENQSMRERELVLQAFDSDVRALQIYLHKVLRKEIKMPYPPPMPAVGPRSWDSLLDEEMRAKQKAYRYQIKPAKRDNTGWEPPNGSTY